MNVEMYKPEMERVGWLITNNLSITERRDNNGWNYIYKLLMQKRENDMNGTILCRNEIDRR